MFVLNISHCHTTPPNAFKNSSKHNSMTINIVVRLLVFGFLSLSSLFFSVNINACDGICFLSSFSFVLLLCTYSVYFNIIPLNCLPRSSATRISNLCVQNKQNAAYAYSAHMYTHKSTFHTTHLSFFLSICHSAIVVLISSTFRWKFVSNTQRKWIN